MIDCSDDIHEAEIESKPLEQALGLHACFVRWRVCSSGYISVTVWMPVISARNSWATKLLIKWHFSGAMWSWKRFPHIKGLFVNLYADLSREQPKSAVVLSYIILHSDVMTSERNSKVPGNTYRMLEAGGTWGMSIALRAKSVQYAQLDILKNRNPRTLLLQQKLAMVRGNVPRECDSVDALWIALTAQCFTDRDWASSSDIPCVHGYHN